MHPTFDVTLKTLWISDTFCKDLISINNVLYVQCTLISQL